MGEEACLKVKRKAWEGLRAQESLGAWDELAEAQGAIPSHKPLCSPGVSQTQVGNVGER